MHTQDALRIGETQRRIFALSAWKESPLFTEQERAALQVTEEVTLISENGLSNETYEAALEIFGENGLAQIIMQVIIINSWNRIAISTKQIFRIAFYHGISRTQFLEGSFNILSMSVTDFHINCSYLYDMPGTIKYTYAISSTKCCLASGIA